MREQQFVLVTLVIFYLAGASAETCDMEVAAVHEGIFGQSADFQWLGVLQVHIQDFDKRHVAMTGIVLIKPKYALANANDVERIPERLFKQDTVAVFIPSEDTPCAFSVLSYVVHPEYGDSTVHSLAVIEIDTDDIKDFSLTPVCLPSENLKKSKNLFLIGFTDENEALEKVFYKIQTLDNSVCDGYNDRRGISDKSSIPAAYVCGYAPYSAVNCLWDDGMALVSKNTGRITLEGLSLYGPGCTAPARYIELYPYMSWIELVTSHQGESFATPHPDLLSLLQPQRRDQFEYIPVHKLFTAHETRRKEDFMEVIGHDFIAYILAPKNKKDLYTITPVDRDNHTLAIYRFDEMHEQFDSACRSTRKLMYREHFHLSAPGRKGQVTYKLSLYDLKDMACICVTLTVNAANRTKAILEFREEFDFMSGTEDLADLDTDIMYKQIALPIRTKKPDEKKPNWLQMEKFKPKTINTQYRKGTVLNNVLYIRIQFTNSASLKFKMFAHPDRMTGPTTLRPTETSTSSTSTSKPTTTRRTTPEPDDDANT